MVTAFGSYQQAQQVARAINSRITSSIENCERYGLLYASAELDASGTYHALFIKSEDDRILAGFDSDSASTLYRAAWHAIRFSARAIRQCPVTKGSIYGVHTCNTSCTCGLHSGRKCSCIA